MSEKDQTAATSRRIPTIAEEAASYQRRVVPRDADVTQRRETTRAFFAGAAALQGILEQIASGLSEQQEDAALLALTAEMRAFARDVVAGRS